MTNIYGVFRSSVVYFALCMNIIYIKTYNLFVIFSFFLNFVIEYKKIKIIRVKILGQFLIIVVITGIGDDQIVSN